MILGGCHDTEQGLLAFYNITSKQHAPINGPCVSSLAVFQEGSVIITGNSKGLAYYFYSSGSAQPKGALYPKTIGNLHVTIDGNFVIAHTIDGVLDNAQVQVFAVNRTSVNVSLNE